MKFLSALTVLLSCCGLAAAQGIGPPGPSEAEFYCDGDNGIANWHTSPRISTRCPNVAPFIQVVTPKRNWVNVTYICLYTKPGAPCPTPPETIGYSGFEYYAANPNPCSGLVFHEVPETTCPLPCGSINAVYKSYLEDVTFAILDYYANLQINGVVANLPPCPPPNEFQTVFCGQYFYVDGQLWDPYRGFRAEYRANLALADFSWKRMIETPCDPNPNPPVDEFSCLPDVNHDSIVDGTDFVVFLNDFASGETNMIGESRADVNDDGIVDGSDFVEFMNAFTSGC